MATKQSHQSEGVGKLTAKQESRDAKHHEKDFVDGTPAIWTVQRLIGLVLSFSAIALSIVFQGTGFLVFFAFQTRLDKYRRSTLIALIVIQSLQIVTYLGSEFGPIISNVGPAVDADEFVDN